MQWLRKLFSKGQKNSNAAHKKEVIKSLKPGNLISVSLNSDFCAFALTQPINRLSHEELLNRRIKGLVSVSIFRNDINIWVLEIQTIRKDSDGFIRNRTTELVEDEIESIKIYE